MKTSRAQSISRAGSGGARDEPEEEIKPETKLVVTDGGVKASKGVCVKRESVCDEDEQ